MIVGRILGRIVILAALAIGGLGLWLWVAGADMTAVAGDFWFEHSAASLNRTQSIVQRYLHPALWDAAFVPLLKRPAYEAFAIGFVALYVVGALIVRLFRGRRRHGEKRLFSQTRE
jgi:hypothetical protein